MELVFTFSSVIHDEDDNIYLNNIDRFECNCKDLYEKCTGEFMSLPGRSGSQVNFNFHRLRFDVPSIAMTTLEHQNRHWYLYHARIQAMNLRVQ